MVAAALCLCMSVWRLRQSYGFFPHLYMRRTRLSAKHPSPYD